jgi:serine O-acetyltransferase
MRLRDVVTNLREDWSENRRLSGALSVITVTIFRIGQYGHHGRGPLATVAKPLHAVLDLTWMKLLIGVELPPSIRCGPGLNLPHCARGSVVHGSARLGSHVTLSHGVTVGELWPKPGAPTIGNTVYLGVKSSVLGPVTMGARSRAAAHALVIKDVPDAHTAIGVPASVRPNR